MRILNSLSPNVLAFLVVLLAMIGAPADAAQLERGRKISQSHCARCHVVGEFNRMGGISSTPSFYLLVREFDDWETRFKTFYTRRPHPAFISIIGIGRPREDLPANAHPISLPPQAVSDVIAYVRTLRKAPTKDQSNN
jgi:mono/diheme cytochrome c family protein